MSSPPCVNVGGTVLRLSNTRDKNQNGSNDDFRRGNSISAEFKRSYTPADAHSVSLRRTKALQHPRALIQGRLR
ncbi:unnamed protein product [Lota lota]